MKITNKNIPVRVHKFFFEKIACAETAEPRTTVSYTTVMFSQACVKNSVHRVEVYTPLVDTPLGRHPLRRHPPDRHCPWADNPRQTLPLGRYPRHPHPRQTVTAVDGTHPTGMHSYVFCFCFICKGSGKVPVQIIVC